MRGLGPRRVNATHDGGDLRRPRAIRGTALIAVVLQHERAFGQAFASTAALAALAIISTVALPRARRLGAGGGADERIGDSSRRARGSVDSAGAASRTIGDP
jgi:hypothetical protein